jgi:hypothetical protein
MVTMYADSHYQIKFVSKPNDATMLCSSKQNGVFDYKLEAFNCADLLARAGTSASVADIYGSTKTPNTLTNGVPAAVSDVTLLNNTGSVSAEDFTLTRVHAGTAADVANFHGKFNTSNTFHGKRGDSKLSFDGYTMEALNFGDVHMIAGNGSDVAYLNGWSGKSTFLGFSTNSQMFGSDYFINVQGFNEVDAQAGNWSDDATFVGSLTEANQYMGKPGKSTLTGDWGGVEADGFHTVTAKAANALDTAFVYGEREFKNTFTYSLHTQKGVMSSSVYKETVEGFETVIATAGTPTDVAILRGAVSIPNTLLASQGTAMLYAGPYSVEADGFSSVTAHGGTAHDMATLTGSSTMTNHFFGAGGANPFGVLFNMGCTTVADNFATIIAQAGTPQDTAYLVGVNPTLIPGGGYVWDNAPPPAKLHGLNSPLWGDYVIGALGFGVLNFG